MKDFLKKISILKFLIICFRIFKNKYGVFKKVTLLKVFFGDYNKLKNLKNNPEFKFKFEDLYPRIYDKINTTPIDPIYFYQDTWCAGKIFENKPEHHYDIGSKAEMLGIISQFVATTMVDIRPLEVSVPELLFLKGSILALPFKNNEIDSLSSICVIEHIGLGRYGDSLDPYGTEKATRELIRVLAFNGNLYISVPIDDENKIYFNAHRAFTRDYILELFKPLKLMEERYIYGNNLDNKYLRNRGFGTGLYHFKKI